MKLKMCQPLEEEGYMIQVDTCISTGKIVLAQFSSTIQEQTY
jgi:hypothetical protein